MIYRTAFILAFTIGGCKVADAPDNLEAMMVYGFTNVDKEPESQALANDLPLLAKKVAEELEKGYRVDSLSKADLIAAGVKNPKLEDPIVGAMGQVRYTHDLPEVLDAVSHKKRQLIVENTEEFEVLSDTDRACFLKKDCLTYRQVAHQVTKQAVVGSITQEFTQEFMWVEHDGEDAVVSRVLAPDPMDVSSGLAAIDQQYSFWLIRQLPKGGCERTEAIWAEARLLGGDLPDTFLVNSAVNAMGKQAEKVDEWINTGEAQ